MSEQVTGAMMRVEIEGLGQTQEAALAALRTGSTYRQAAEAAGVSRPTIYRWMQSDPHFRAAYNAWKQEQTESARGRLLKMADQAVDVLEQGLRANDRHVAMQVLKGTGALRQGRREATDPKVLKLQMDLLRFRDEYRAARALVEHLQSHVTNKTNSRVEGPRGLRIPEKIRSMPPRRGRAAPKTLRGE
jgi:transposase-like protein